MASSPCLPSPDATLQVDTVVANATVSEKSAFQLDCSIVSRSSQDSHFAVTWYSLRTKAGGKKGSRALEEEEMGEEEEENDEEEDHEPTERTALLHVDADSVFGAEGSPWEGRLRFQKLSPLLYRLTVLEASPQDTGNYSCRVEEWLPSPLKELYRLTEEESAPISIRVLDTSECFLCGQRKEGGGRCLQLCLCAGFLPGLGAELMSSFLPCLGI